MSEKIDNQQHQLEEMDRALEDKKTMRASLFEATYQIRGSAPIRLGDFLEINSNARANWKKEQARAKDGITQFLQHSSNRQAAYTIPCSSMNIIIKDPQLFLRVMIESRIPDAIQTADKVVKAVCRQDAFLAGEYAKHVQNREPIGPREDAAMSRFKPVQIGEEVVLRHEVITETQKVAPKPKKEDDAIYEDALEQEPASVGSWWDMVAVPGRVWNWAFGATPQT